MNKDEIYKAAKKYCPILYKDNCMWCIGNGWYDLMYDFSLLCEEINLTYYKKYRYRISLSQVKEKYGSLRIYFDIIKDPPVFINSIINILEKIDNIYFSKNMVEYDLKKIVDKKPYKKITFSIINDTPNEEQSIFSKNILKINNKNVSTSIINNFEKYHYIPTKHKIKYIFKNINMWLIKKFDNLFYKEINNDSIYNIIYLKIRKLINEYEQKSNNICEECGMHLNNGYTKKCSTVGWIRILCEDCAKKSNQEYYIGDKKFKNGESCE